MANRHCYSDTLYNITVAGMFKRGVLYICNDT